MLSDATLERILERLPGVTVGVLGDLFLDRYLDIDPRLTEPSLETGLDAYQVVNVRSLPGAAGTVINNLAALGVGTVRVVSCVGDDGEGYELRQALDRFPAVEAGAVLIDGGRRTPTYTKPLVCETGRPARELNRLDIKNRHPLPAATEDRIIEALDGLWARAHAWVVLDQVSEPECGVLTTRVRARLTKRAQSDPDRFTLADSRERIGLFDGVSTKPNERECLRATGGAAVEESARRLAATTGRPVFCTLGERGMLLVEPGERPRLVSAYPVAGPIDVVGAGDSTSAGIAAAIAAGADVAEAAAFGNLVASITVQQIGTTGTASPEQVRARWVEVRSWEQQ